MIKKDFNCVEMKHKSAEKIAQKISGLSTHKELEFWKMSTQRLLKSKKQLNKKSDFISASPTL